MGLSTKQVPGDQDFDWSKSLLESAAATVELPKPPSLRRQQQQQQQQAEPLNCPRCGSTNTKFCYYNNYNKSQPRHFCKACRRHWTKGGTLRNVPVGGGRKNKRLKISNGARSSSASASDRSNLHGVAQNQQDSNSFQLPAAPGDQKNISDILYQALINSSSSSIQHDPIPVNGFSSKTLMGNKGSSSGSMLSLPQDHQDLQFSFSSLSPFPNISCPINPSLNQSFNRYDYGEKVEHSMESSTVTSVIPASSSSIFSQPWQGPTTSSIMTEMSNYWNWNDIDTLVSADLNIPWDDTEIKP